MGRVIVGVRSLRSRGIATCLRHDGCHRPFARTMSRSSLHGSSSAGPCRGQAPATGQTRQLLSAGDSSHEIHAAALASARPAAGLTWLDIGCGRGHLLRAVRERYRPASLIGVDLLDWLDADLRRDVDLRLGAAELVLADVPPADRVLMGRDARASRGAVDDVEGRGTARRARRSPGCHDTEHRLGPAPSGAPRPWTSHSVPSREPSARHPGAAACDRKDPPGRGHTRFTELCRTRCHPANRRSPVASGRGPICPGDDECELRHECAPAG
jgi:hypothetical protein